ncbi:DNA double-strand break repair helicase HerA [uncultured archaeon]|nr:DNA double-strand break repair helicase HerA [uncultured archaeon]
MEGDDYFAEQSTIDLDKLLTSGLVSIDLSGLPDETFRALGALTILQFIKEKMRFEGWKPDRGVKLWVVLDEAWKISRDENSDAVMIVREGRKYQFGLIVASQTPTDISEVIFSNVGTVIMLRLKFEKYLDYLQNSLRFSNYVRQQILGFGMGQAAVSMAYEQSTPFSETFILKKIDGEEPIIDYFLDIASVLTEAQRRDDTMPKSYSMERTAFKKRIREMGLSEDKVEELATMIEKKAKHFDAVDFVIELERRGVTRKIITVFFRELGIDDSTIINIFTRADQKKTGLTERDISQVTLE